MIKNGNNLNSVSTSNLTAQNYDEFSEKSFDAPPKYLHKKQQSMMASPSMKSQAFATRLGKSRASNDGKSAMMFTMTEKKLNTYMNQAKMLIDKGKEETLSGGFSERDLQNAISV